MKRTLLFAAALLFCAACGTPAGDSLALWYDRPAGRWEETLPLGNGRLGAMPDGGILRERIILNDITCWSGSEQPTANAEALDYLPRIRALLLEGRNLEAQRMMYRHFVCSGGGSAEAAYGSYEMLGQLDFDFAIDTAGTSGYRRSLSLSDATARTRFEAGGVVYERDYFVSRTDDVVAVRLRASRPGALSFRMTLSRPSSAVSEADEAAGDRLVMCGQLPSGREGVEGVKIRSEAAVRTRGGEVKAADGVLSVEGADEAVVYVSSATDYFDRLAGREPEELAERVGGLLSEALSGDFDAQRRAHTADHRRLFDRVALDLGPEVDLPTDERLAAYGSGEADPAFAALYMQFGRYLMISSTREGMLPPNLQGMWANTVDCRTPWRGDYHTNINVEMNHWITGPGNLGELQLPLVDYVERMLPSGECTARDFYGTKGWCAHVLANGWNFTAPSENPSWGATNTGGAWLALHLWEQYRFHPDTVYLRRVYPVLRGAAEFFLENLIEEPDHGYLVTAPTSSPENGYYDESDREITFVCMGSTMDAQILRELFGAVGEASATLGIDEAFAVRLRAAARRLPPEQVSEQGYLLEWLKDYREMDIHHRHVSHLFGLYPGTQLTRSTTPELLEACRATLDRRGDDGTGWSRAWKICFWARIGDGDRAAKLLASLLRPAYTARRDAEGRTTYDGEGAGTYPNLFCAHPPFQIDGNFGGAAGIAEMLLQSHDGCIELLPALPRAWATGSYRGLRARGGVEVDCRWADGRVVEATLRADNDCTVRLRIPGRDEPIEVACRAGRSERVALR